MSSQVILMRIKRVGMELMYQGLENWGNSKMKESKERKAMKIQC